MSLLLLASGAGAQTEQPRRIAAAVTYVTAGGVYFDAGKVRGIAVGDTVRVVRAGSELGRAVVTAVSSSSSLASILNTGMTPGIGDSTVVWKIVEEQAPLAAATRNVGTGTSAGPESGSNAISGRLAIQYGRAGVSGQAPDFSQPAVVGRLDVDKLFGTSMSLRVYGRAFGDMTERYYRYGTSNRWQTRFYELSLTDDGPRQWYGFALGRFYPHYVGGLGSFDGGEVYARVGRVTAGVAAGAQANYLTSGIDPEHQKFAAFVNYSWGRDAWQRSDVTVAYGQQRYKGRLDRNFTYMQAAIRLGEDFFFFGSSEFDFHKITNDAVVSRFHLTNTFLTLTYTMPFRWLTLNAGFDASRPVPLLESERTYVDSLLDRSLREGLRGSLAILLPGRVVITTTGNYRMPTRTAPEAHTITAAVRASDILNTGLGLGAQYGAITTVYTRGKNMVLDLDRWITDWFTAAVRFDRYDYQLPDRNEQHRTTTASLNASCRLSRAWYAALSMDQIWEDQRTTQRLYFELGFHF